MKDLDKPCILMQLWSNLNRIKSKQVNDDKTFLKGAAILNI